MDAILDFIYIHPVACLFVAAAFWIGFRGSRLHRIDTRYGVTESGGHCGVITVCKGQDTFRAEYEVGVTVDLIINSSSFMSADKLPLAAEKRAELAATLLAWAKARGTTLEIIDN